MLRYVKNDTSDYKLVLRKPHGDIVYVALLVYGITSIDIPPGSAWSNSIAPTLEHPVNSQHLFYGYDIISRNSEEMLDWTNLYSMDLINMYNPNQL